MEETPGGLVMALRAAGSTPPPPPTSSSRAVTEVPSATAAAAAPPPPPTTWRRERFTVELKPGETTIVSWKKLQKEGSKGSGASSSAPTGAHPGLESRIAPAMAPAGQAMECEPKDGQPPSNRFSAVIEKIERLYMGKESSDEEELGNIPDDDQYDTEDSFIDDTELNDYFQVDKSTTKHQGFYINRGKLEHMESSSSPNLAPKKRRRRDSANAPIEKDTGSMPNAFVDVSNMKMKNAARHAPLVVKKVSSPSNIPTVNGEHYQDEKYHKTKQNTSTGILKKKVEPSPVNAEHVSSPKFIPNKELHPMDIKDNKEQKVAAAQSRDAVKFKGVGDAEDTTHETGRDKGPSFKGENVVSTKIRTREKNGIVELPDLNIPGNMYPLQATVDPTRVKETTVRPKGPMLERAILDLEKVVAEYKPAKQEIQDADTPQGVKKRLPIEIKMKLAKVARLANNQGKIASEEFIGRLMGILGHLVQPKTLKRHLKEMVELGLSAKQAKADRFQLIKKEVTEMIKTRIAASRSRAGEQPTGSSDDFQESERALRAKMSMDDGIEDKICDLYDLYVEGMDEDKGPQMRKLYGELAELWPAGFIDSSGIKEAINRAKGRKRALYKQQKVQDEQVKRRRLSSASRPEDAARANTQPRASQERLTDAALHLNGSSNHHAQKHQDKAMSKSNTSIATDAASRAIVSMKKSKRPLDGGPTAVRTQTAKLTPHGSSDKDSSLKQSANTADGYFLKSGLNSSVLSGAEQPSR